MRFQPVYPFTAVGDQGNLQFDCIFHFIQHDLFHFFQFVLVDVEVQFIVYLQDHLALQTFGFETVEDANHGNFDDVGCTALDRSVDRVSSSTLSGGQKQRLAIACAIFSGRGILILDEPTSGLDGQNMRLIAERLRSEARNGRTILVITHDRELIESCCDNIVDVEKRSS